LAELGFPYSYFSSLAVSSFNYPYKGVRLHGTIILSVESSSPFYLLSAFRHTAFIVSILHFSNMGEREFFNTMTLLRVAPLLTSSFQIWFSFDQFFFLSTFLHPRVRQKANGILPSYFDCFFRPGVGIILSLYTSTIGFGIANVLTRRPKTSHLYAAGVAFAAAHFAFVPFVMDPVEALVEDRNKGQSTKDMQRWLSVHSVRSILVDFPGWACFLLATMNALKPV
jgi:hypothetical protein